LRLTSIKIFGFKSFADKLEIDVDGDLVAVVGPNGCGKSNIVDAILWTLGELSPRSLRAVQASDVIFNGSARRKPVGYAEVSLVFDNEDGALPISTTEVVVTRRLDRKGDSHYSINRQGCRLKDIYELFADSGLGRTGYAIVSQKDIDSALDASPEERRIWIDEAAGVQRYRSRKVEALKRLDNALTHLQRVDDVLGEIENQREPLREQAEAAIIFKQAMASLREVESGLLLREAADLAAEVARLEASIVEKRRSGSALQEGATKAEAHAADISHKIAALEAEIETARAELQRLSTQLERAVSKKALAEQRVESVDEIEADKDREAEVSRQRTERAEAALALAEAEAQDLRRHVESLLREISGSGEETKRLADLLARAEAGLLEARRAQVSSIEQSARVGQAKSRLQAVERELEGAMSSIPSLAAGSAEAEAALEASRTDLDARRAEAKAIGESGEHLAAKMRAAEEERRAILSERAKLEGSAQGLRATLESFEGLPTGARALLTAFKEGRISGDFVPASSVIHAPASYALAIEAALGASAGDLITSDSRFAKEAIAMLKAEGLGRATFLAADLLNPRPRSAGIEKLAQSGAIGIAADLVTCESKHRKAVELLLGGVLITRSLDDATKLAKEQGFRKIATLEGEIVYAGGAITGGRSSKQAAGPIHVASQLDEVEKRISELGTRAEAVEAEILDLATQEAASSEKASAARAEILEKEAEVGEAIHWLASVREEHAATERAIAKLRAEMESLSALVAEPDSVAAVPVEEMEAERNRLLAEAAAKSADAQRAERSLSEAQERLAASESRLEHAHIELESAKESDQFRAARLGSLADERDLQRQRIAEASAEAAALEQQIQVRAAALEDSMELKKNLGEEHGSRLAEARAASESARAIEDSAYGDDIARARAETKRAGILGRLLEDYDVDEAEAAAQAPLVELPPDAQRVANRLRREIRELGDVNVGAIEAYERLTERFDTLTEQREDILASKAELDKSVAELDRLTRGSFADTFAKVNEAFCELFQKLFDGGEARLSLAEPDNMLESGVEVNVQIPGKKTQRLELLSGGERALSACAFLFALLKVKPSPLCVLDELDAPLDGRNVERFVEMLKAFAERAQFIVITHNPTTIEAAPVWFGVTMQEPGVSTVIPYRASVAAPALASNN
jgi:chromosome segregation protein